MEASTWNRKPFRVADRIESLIVQVVLRRGFIFVPFIALFWLLCMVYTIVKRLMFNCLKFSFRQ